MNATPNKALSTLKDHEFLTDLLNDIEAKFEINDLKHYGIRLWPLVRLQLGRSFKYSDLISDAGLGDPKTDLQSGSSSNSGSKQIEEIKQTTDQGPLPRNRSQRAALLKEHAANARQDVAGSRIRVEKDWQTLAGLDAPDFLVLTKLEKYYKKTKNGYYAPILDPVSEDLAQFGTVQRMSIEPFPLTCVNQPIIVDMNAYLAMHKWQRVEADQSVIKLLDEIIAYASDKWPEWPIEAKAIFNRLERIRARRDFFYETFSRLKPKFVVLSSFTGWLHALWACKDLNIPVIDVQHGGQGPIHYPSTHYSRFPEDGYHLLPDVFWLWGEYNRQFAAPWNPGTAKSRHIPVVGGHRGIAKWHREREANSLPAIDQDFIEDNKSKTCVLITLSYALDPLMPDNLFELVKKCPNLKWLVRLHPIHRSSLARNQIFAKLTQLGVKDFDIDVVTDVQLQTALFVSKFHITPFSTSVREAQAFGVPSALCHEAGYALFENEIATGQLSYATSPDELRTLMMRAIADKSGSNVDPHAIRIDIEGVSEVIEVAKAVKKNAKPLLSENSDGVYALPKPGIAPLSKHPQPSTGTKLGRFLTAVVQKFKNPN